MSEAARLITPVLPGDETATPIPPTVDDGAMPLPTDVRTVLLAWLTVLASLAALYAASEIVLPVVLAIVLKLLLQPVVRWLEDRRVPRSLGAILAILLLVVALGAIGTALTGPATAWASRLPAALPRLQSHLAQLQRPVAAFQDMLAQLGSTAGAGQGVGMPFGMSSMIGSLFAGTRLLMSTLFTTMLLLFYLLVFGEVFLRRVVEILPGFGNKRQAVEISMQIETDLSAYLVTITAINAGVGAATFAIMWGCGVPDPLLWAVAALLLNYVPILGPITGIALFCAIGMLTKGVDWLALLPAGLYFLVHLAEGEWITPLLVARRFTINPVAIVLALVFWFWMWGVPGAVLAVPMLAITKIMCDRVRPLRAFGHFLEG